MRCKDTQVARSHSNEWRASRRAGKEPSERRGKNPGPPMAPAAGRKEYVQEKKEEGRERERERERE